MRTSRTFYSLLGEPPRTGTATVRCYTENKNDEEPKFSQQEYTPNVDENAGPNTLVTTVVTLDKDGDGVTFGFIGGPHRRVSSAQRRTPASSDSSPPTSGSIMTSMS